jgi:hypothetical protein
MTIAETLSLLYPMKWAALENPIVLTQSYIKYASRWVAMDEVERLVDNETPYELEILFTHCDNQEIVQSLVDIWSTVN